MTDRMVRDNHLGGYILGGDDRTFYPEVWNMVIKDLNIKSIIDVGCGEGHSSKFFSNLNLEVLAIDGSKLVLNTAVFKPIIIHDYALGPYIPSKKYDLVWCCEFVEHVEEKFILNFLETFKKAKYVLMTHALPKQGGYHHVNEKTDLYWISEMAKEGFLIKPELTKKYRELGHDYFKASGLLFINTNL